MLYSTVIASLSLLFALSTFPLTALASRGLPTQLPAKTSSGRENAVNTKKSAKTSNRKLQAGPAPSMQTESSAANPPSNSNTEESEPEVAPKGGVGLDASSAIRLNYGRNDWNRDPKQLDAAAIYLREGATGRIVQIEVDETAPDSAVFSGTYRVNWEKIETLKTEFYAPPQDLLSSMEGRMKISKLIQNKELRRLPFVLRKDPVTGVQNVELFDSPDQARLAYKAFQSEQQLLVALQNKLAARNQTVDTAQLKLEREELEAASKNLAERVRLSQVETQRLQQLLKEFSALSPEERARRKAEAVKRVDQALMDYKAERFKEARASFDKAVELDPANRDYYYLFGITLYRLDEFNRSLVYLELAEGKSVKQIEREYYRGLCFYKLKDSASALSAFAVTSKATNDPLAASATFYRGLIYYEKKKWEEARNEFQKVLDQSNDPALDQQAEAYIEYILRYQQYDAERAKKWSLSATVGFMSDDNVLLASDSDRDRGSATNLSAYRSLFQGTARYRPVFEETQEFAAQLDFLTMYSVDSSFQSVQSITNADPTVIGLTLPWTHKGVFVGRGHKFDFVPGYELTYMSLDNNQWKAIYASITMGFQNLFVMNERWYTNVNVDIRQDTSNISSSTGDADASALKTKITWSNILFAFEDKKKLLTTESAYTMNDAKGKNAVYNRLDLSVGYIQPWMWETTFNSKLGYYLLNYSQNTSGRTDNDYALTLGLSRKAWGDVTAGLTATYAINSSNVTANQYKKTTVLLSFSSATAF